MINFKKLSLYCRGEFEKIENYEQALADKTQTWECHHRLELTINGEFAHSGEELDRMGMYKKRPHYELILLTKKDHMNLHGKVRKQDKTRNSKISKSLTCKRRPDVSEQNKRMFTGKKPWNTGTKGLVKVEEERKQRYSKLYKGKHWRIVNGKREWY